MCGHPCCNGYTSVENSGARRLTTWRNDASSMLRARSSIFGARRRAEWVPRPRRRQGRGTALQIHENMAAEQSRVVRFVIGAAEGVEQARDTLERLVDPVTISVTHERAVAFWDRLLGRVEVQTPEPSMDLLLNGWLVSRFGPAYLRSGVGT